MLAGNNGGQDIKSLVEAIGQSQIGTEAAEDGMERIILFRGNCR